MEASLASIDDQREKTRERLEALRREVALTSPKPTVALHEESRTASTPKTPADKVRLFRSLFRGRPDVYSAVLLHRLWVTAEVYEPLRNQWPTANTSGGVAQAIPA